MTERDHSEFTIDTARNRYLLPVDSSSSEFEKRLKKAYPSKNLSRNAMRCMMKDVPVVKTAEPGDAGSLYDYLNKERVVPYAGKKQMNGAERYTYELPIYWELQDLLQAFCIARKNKRTLKDEALAEEALAILIDNMQNRPANTLGRKYTEYQLLKEEYVQAALIKKHEGDILQRLDVIYSLLLSQPAKVSVKMMQKAIPALDALVVELTQIEHDDEPKGPLTALSCVQSYFNRLMRVRPTAGERGKFKFKLNGYSLDMKILKNRLNKLMSPAGCSIEDQQAAENAYEQYLFRVSEKQDPTHSQTREFIKAYSEIDAYVCGTVSWAETEQQIKGELHTYIRNMFEDITELEYIPYDTSDFQQEHAKSAFIAEFCKNAHNQIRCNLHTALRLITKVLYLMYYHPYAPMNVPYSHMLSELLASQISDWISSADKERKRLSDTYRDLPLLVNASSETVNLFVEQYNSKVAAIFNHHAVSKEEIELLVQKSQSEPVLLYRMYNMGTLLMHESRMVAWWIAEEAVKEMKQRYETLQRTYKAAAVQRQKSKETANGSKNQIKHDAPIRDVYQFNKRALAP